MDSTDNDVDSMIKSTHCSFTIFLNIKEKKKKSFKSDNEHLASANKHEIIVYLLSK